jgi:hypothetical protein
VRREETDFKTLAGAFFQMFSRLVFAEGAKMRREMCFVEFVIPSCYSSSLFYSFPIPRGHIQRHCCKYRRLGDVPWTAHPLYSRP